MHRNGNFSAVFCALLTAGCAPSPTSSGASRPPAATPSFASKHLPERALGDRPDDKSGHQVHVIYALPSDGVDRALDTDGTIASSMAAIDAWLQRQTGGPHLRLDTWRGALDVTFVRFGMTDRAIAASAQYVRDVLEAELAAQGFARRNKLYAVYYDGLSTASCGGGAWPPKAPGHVAALYLRGVPADGARRCVQKPIGTSPDTPSYVELGFLHEMFRSLGIVGACAPHHCRSGHVSDDPRDLMYAGDAPWHPSLLDVGHDDYYAHGQTDCLDLARSAYLEPLPSAATPPPE